MCVEYKESNNSEIMSSAEKVVRPWPDRPDRRLRPWPTASRNRKVLATSERKFLIERVPTQPDDSRSRLSGMHTAKCSLFDSPYNLLYMLLTVITNRKQNNTAK